SRAVTEQRSRPLAPPQPVRLQVNLPERVLSGFGDSLQSHFALAQRLFGELLLGDVALCSPCADNCPVFFNAVLVVQEVFRISVPIKLARFDIGQAITGKSEGMKKGDILRV